MALPRPTHQFTIPSVYDDVQLQCRLYHPIHLKPSDKKSTWTKKGAMVAHPYAPLGGCYDDPVVAIIADELLKAGYIVGTFNLRGAGGSQGRTSWTGRPELGDFVSFYAFLVYYILGLDPISKPSSDTATGSGSARGEPSRAEIIVSGYSYGSMLATYLPSLESIQIAFEEHKEAKAPVKILQEAHNMSSKWNRGIGSQDDANQPCYPAHSIETTESNDINISYLLVSPILPPISLFTATALLTSTSKLTTTIQGKLLQGSDLHTKASEHRTLALYGDRDGFTSSKRSNDLCEELKKLEHSRFGSVLVEGAGHFWHEDEAEVQMRNAIRNWIATDDIYPDLYSNTTI
ncbi:uncharacterized protein GIQ15_06250 [Arthroderma uncinatum]|uniref:uncharacterized protein n=1 Tax=Arthroderma uncinatum TaxID=74035 RepID=UPI00144A74F5|nr:uncharacterized protein GIQ15_06250 [Arthroderma uncinatum]KAF3480903.1 hypothetical protein GIQ15_06250 [Arthroderma uncinatum]